MRFGDSDFRFSSQGLALYIHLLPAVDISDGAIHWCEGGRLSHKTIYATIVRGLMYGRLLRDTVAINDATCGCKEWTTERGSLGGLQVQGLQLIHSEYSIVLKAGQIIDVNFDRN